MLYEKQSDVNSSALSKMAQTMEQAFLSQLNTLKGTQGDRSHVFGPEKIKEIIEDVILAKSKNRKGLTDKDRRRMKVFDVVSIRGEETLIRKRTSASGEMKIILQSDKMFDVVDAAHKILGHRGRIAMEHEINKKYANISRDVISIYLRLCEVCQLKRKSQGKGMVIKPIRTRSFNERAQVDLIDYQSVADGEYKFILNYQDHFTKFCTLRALKSKTAEEVAENLVNIFCIFGAPYILQSDNGREFKNQLMDSLTVKFPGLKIVHGRPRHSQSQGSVERANQDVRDLMAAWLKDNNTTEWARGLQFVQLKKNRSFHQGIRQSPHEALFGAPQRVGLQDLQIPADKLLSIGTEEELEEVLNSIHVMEGGPLETLLAPEENDQTSVAPEENDQTSVAPEEGGPLETLLAPEESDQTSVAPEEGGPLETLLAPEENDQTSVAPEEGGPLETLLAPEENDQTSVAPEKSDQTSVAPEEGGPLETSMALEENGQTAMSPEENPICVVCEENIGEDDLKPKCVSCKLLVHADCSLEEENVICGLCYQKTRLRNLRKRAAIGLNAQADRMLEVSNKRFKPVGAGDNVLVTIPSVDRSRIAPRNIMAVVMNYDDQKQLYKLGTSSGILDKGFSRNEFQPATSNFLKVEHVPELILSVRTAAGKESGRMQGFVFCACAKGCKSNSCKCKKNGLLCNSKCHKSLSCNNK